jgi:hypothetical protein
MSDHQETPQDDSGIKPQQLLDICDKVIDRCWHELGSSSKELPLEHLEKILQLSMNAWSLAVNVFMHSNETEEQDDDDEKEPWQQ